ncbi:GNAT family N-acetyltransferase [Nocardioides sp.]|uniref:GNAT family N-acetyltransferase n=1 Tax=Nocardioides sp. TaxID=35761 RepID=UPI002733E165|nr:GNAT family N-acetyltransferase [Nocardioides sp.]MDP3894657.1 GNAT family N-acetyltransferase [Nocardioides sp.]
MSERRQRPDRAFVVAGPDDAVALRDLEREANLASLGQVFPPDRFPYPADDVLARWHIVLTDPDATTLVVRADHGGLDALVAFDSASVRHLAVRPVHWGTGLARAALGHAVRAITAEGEGPAELWCLVDNHRARGLYEHLGWSATADRQEAPWPPHPVEMRYLLPGTASRPA